jgi:predicted protein tyrosine phosphatase
MINQTPFIQNVSRRDIELGYHAASSDEHTVLIQISDTSRDQPIPASKYTYAYEFFFDDIETETDIHGEVGITDEDAAKIADILKTAWDNDYDVIVHCHAGLCRSGAVAQAGEAIGFANGGRDQVPNLRVKHKVMAALGLSYDEGELAKFTLLRRLMENV